MINDFPFFFPMYIFKLKYEYVLDTLATKIQKVQKA